MVSLFGSRAAIACSASSGCLRRLRHGLFTPRVIVFWFFAVYSDWQPLLLINELLFTTVSRYLTACRKMARRYRLSVAIMATKTPKRQNAKTSKRQNQKSFMSQRSKAFIRINPSLSLVREVVVSLMVKGNYSLLGVAQNLNLSERSLQRIIENEGTCYRDLLSSIRREHACTMLRINGIKIKDVARALGYTDSASFSRAFHRWENCSPVDWRINNRLQAQSIRSSILEGEQH